MWISGQRYVTTKYHFGQEERDYLFFCGSDLLDGLQEVIYKMTDGLMASLST